MQGVKLNYGEKRDISRRVEKGNIRKNWKDIIAGKLCARAWASNKKSNTRVPKDYNPDSVVKAFFQESEFIEITSSEKADEKRRTRDDWTKINI